MNIQKYKNTFMIKGLLIKEGLDIKKLEVRTQNI